MKTLNLKLLIILGILILCLSVFVLCYFHLIPVRSYLAKDFNITTIKSDLDFNRNSLDDYTDILTGARMYLYTNPKYKSDYYEGGYPPLDEGMCTDVIWNAFANAGYSLKDLVDEDIKNNISFYSSINKPDTNIDFRRVEILDVFFKKNSQILTTDTSLIDQWQAGDIVVYKNHIAIVSDKRNKKGIPYILHNNGQPVKEEDSLQRYFIVGHYRWNGI